MVHSGHHQLCNQFRASLFLVDGGRSLIIALYRRLNRFGLNIISVECVHLVRLCGNESMLAGLPFLFVVVVALKGAITVLPLIVCPAVQPTEHNRPEMLLSVSLGLVVSRRLVTIDVLLAFLAVALVELLGWLVPMSIDRLSQYSLHLKRADWPSRFRSARFYHQRDKSAPPLCAVDPSVTDSLHSIV